MIATIYTKPNCKFCTLAKELFDEADILYDEVSATVQRETLFRLVNAAIGADPQTVPQIFIDGTYIGGHAELVRWFDRNRR